MKARCPRCGGRAKVKKSYCPGCGKVERLLVCSYCGAFTGPLDERLLLDEVNRVCGGTIEKAEFLSARDVVNSPDWELVSEGVYRNKKDPRKFSFDPRVGEK